MKTQPRLVWFARFWLPLCLLTSFVFLVVDDDHTLDAAQSVIKVITDHWVWLLFLFFVLPKGFSAQSWFQEFAFRTPARCVGLIAFATIATVWIAMGRPEGFDLGRTLVFGKGAETSGIFTYQPIRGVDLYNKDPNLLCQLAKQAVAFERRYRICYSGVGSIGVHGCEGDQQRKGAIISAGACRDYSDRAYLYVSKPLSQLGTVRATELSRWERILSR